VENECQQQVRCGYDPPSDQNQVSQPPASHRIDLAVGVSWAQALHISACCKAGSIVGRPILEAGHRKAATCRLFFLRMGRLLSATPAQATGAAESSPSLDNAASKWRYPPRLGMLERTNPRPPRTSQMRNSRACSTSSACMPARLALIRLLQCASPPPRAPACHANGRAERLDASLSCC
jgi:hypothetical protein